jgi:lysophospholipase L1-like esterase
MRKQFTIVLGAVTFATTLALGGMATANAAVGAHQATAGGVTSADCPSAGVGALSAAQPAAECAHGTVKGSDVLFIGDSFFALSGQIHKDIEVHAKAAQALGANDSYRDASVSGALIAGIAQQYSSQQSRTPVKILIMDGTGNDMLAASGCTSASCSGITNAVNTTKNLFAKIGSDGTVQHVLYVWYPTPPIANLAKAEDLEAPLIQSICTGSKAPCHFVDLRPVFQGHSNYIMSDGLHPTAAGAQAAADAIWAAMQKNCIAQ